MENKKTIKNLEISKRSKKSFFVKISLWARLRRMIARTFIAVLSFLSRIYVPYIFLGVVNRVLPLFESIFICYAGDQRYAKHYTFEWLETVIKWTPTPIGFFKQGNHWGIVFASPMTERDFLSDKNEHQFKKIINRLHFIAKLLNVKKVRYAGILPKIVEKRFSIDSSSTNKTTARAVFAAYKRIIRENSNMAQAPVIILGGSGFLGRQVCGLLEKDSVKTHVVDLVDGSPRIPPELYGQTSVLLDVSRKNVIDRYLEDFWPEMLVINETFPEPSKKTVSKLKLRGIRVLHLSGVHGKVFPPLPHAYSSSVPCCAIHDDHSEIIPIIKEL